MPLTGGFRLGPYEVVSALGAGGMGEVYRARDTKLNRDVAIKVLPEAVAADPDYLARFQREAQVLASLNHPNIAHIYGLEALEGRDGRAQALVMELVEGPTLADRIAQGRLPVDETLAVAAQIIDALEAAHEQGIVHRDLKPANIKLRPDGAVKVLDFGLAKALEPAASGLNLTAAPTITTPAMTLAGMVLGTAAYMSPEQARGRAVDKRTDIWAFGCVLFEMLTGRRPFGGDDIAEALGAVIHKDVPWSQLPASTPATVRTVLERCLEKDPKQRIRDIGDVRLALAGEFGSQAPFAASIAPTAWSKRVIAFAAAAGLMLGLAVAATVALVDRRPVPAPVVTRFSFVLPDGFVYRTNARNPVTTKAQVHQLEVNGNIHSGSQEEVDDRVVAGDMVLISGEDVGGSGVHYLLGRIASLGSPSASPSPSASFSASPSVSPSASRSSSPSASSSPSSSPSLSPSASTSASPSLSPSFSVSPSASPSRSPSASASLSPSSSVSRSPSRSPSASPSAS